MQSAPNTKSLLVLQKCSRSKNHGPSVPELCSSEPSKDDRQVDKLCIIYTLGCHSAIKTSSVLTPAGAQTHPKHSRLSEEDRPRMPPAVYMALVTRQVRVAVGAWGQRTESHWVWGFLLGWRKHWHQTMVMVGTATCVYESYCSLHFSAVNCM